MDGYCLQGRVEESKLIDVMVSKGHEPNVVSYNTLISGFCKIHQVNVSMNLFQEVSPKGFKPNIVTCNTVIQGLFRAKKLSWDSNVHRNASIWVDSKCHYSQYFDGRLV
ncbi:hypothetical protein Ancab_024075 [Ancistrocladus abbreviatus]